MAGVLTAACQRGFGWATTRGVASQSGRRAAPRDTSIAWQSFSLTSDPLNLWNLPMKAFGNRQAKAHLSQLVRNAAKGESGLVTENRMPVAVIGPPSMAANVPGHSVVEELALSDAEAFSKALFGAPYPFEVDF